MRRLPDGAFRLLEADGTAHRTREPRIGTGSARPGALIQSAKHQRIETLQPRFERAQDRQSGMALARAPHGFFLGEIAKERRVAAGFHCGQLQRRIPQFVDEARGDVSRFACPQRIACENGRRLQMRRERIADGDGVSCSHAFQRPQRRDDIGEPIGKLRQMRLR